MTLGQRLLLATGILSLAVAAAVVFGVREAWRETEAERFRAEFRLAVNQLETELRRELSELSALIDPICEHDPVIDSALVGLRTSRLDAPQRLSVSARAKSLAKALRVDELFLVTGEGEVLGTGNSEAKLGSIDEALAEKIQAPNAPGVRQGEPWAFEATCVREEAGYAVGIYALRNLSPLLDQVAASHGVTWHHGTELDEVSRSPDAMHATVDLPELGGLSIVLSRSRVPLSAALKHLDVTIFAIGGGTVLAALAIAFALSRGLSRPIVRLSEQAREVVGGEPKPVKATGGRELEELADAFNQAISDLVSMRGRLAAIERVAAWKEMAQRVAHEIKNPLAPIRAAMETLRRLRARNDPAFDEYFDEATTTVLDEVRRIAAITTEFTRFARLPAPNLAPTDVAALLRQVVRLHQGQGTSLSLKIRECPAVPADRDQLTQVATNLIQNALDAVNDNPNGGVEVCLRRARNGGRDWLEVTVDDSGPGVSAEVRARLFEPYFTTKQSGTGLGLAIVQRIVTEHGGEIRYADSPLGGARFIIRLPLFNP